MDSGILSLVPALPVLLLAEDDADMAFLVCREFRRLLPDWEVCHVANGREAMRRLVLLPEPSALVTDLNMPDMDGFALIEWVRNLALALPIVVLSSAQEPDAPGHCRKLGADHFFAKNIEGLRETIRAVIECLRKKVEKAGSPGLKPPSGDETSASR